MNRCDSCKNVSECAICCSASDYFHHVGVRGTANRLRIPVIDYNITYDKQPSGVWALFPTLQSSSLSGTNIIHRELQRRAPLAGRLHLAEHLLGQLLHQANFITMDEKTRASFGASRVRR